MKCKRIILGVMLAVLIFPMAVASAENDVDYEIISETELPENVTPIVAETEEEANKIANEINCELQSINESNDLVYGQRPELNEKQKSITYFDQTYTGTRTIVGTNFNVMARARVKQFNRPTDVLYTIESIYYTDCYLSGNTMGFDITDKNSYAVIASNKYSMYVYGSATFNYYIFVSGGIRYYSEPISYSFTAWA